MISMTPEDIYMSLQTSSADGRPGGGCGEQIPPISHRPWRGVGEIRQGRVEKSLKKPILIEFHPVFLPTGSTYSIVWISLGVQPFAGEQLARFVSYPCCYRCSSSPPSGGFFLAVGFVPD